MLQFNLQPYIQAVGRAQQIYCSPLQRLRVQMNKLYCLALVQRRDLASLRDLRPQHLPLLRNVLRKGLEAIKTQFGVSGDEIFVFLHYLPSYFHLHVHFVHTDAEPTHGMQVAKAHMLADVISCIELCGDFYKRATLTCALGQHDALYAQLTSYISDVD
jgi:m7GpppX diphosphatase